MKPVCLARMRSARFANEKLSGKRNVIKVALALVLVVSIGHRAQAAALIVSADDWPTRVKGSWDAAPYDQTRFVQNVGSYFANGTAGASFLVMRFDGDPYTGYGSNFQNSLNKLGYSVTYNNAATSFSSYAGVFLGPSTTQNATVSTATANALASYLLNGGNVYVYGGIHWSPGYWNPLLNKFGLNLSNTSDGITGNINSFSTTDAVGSKIFAGVDSLYSEDASILTRSAIDPGISASGWSNSVIASYVSGPSTFVRFAEAHAVPAPPALALLGIGLLGFVRLRKKLVKK